jgi:uncharacterized membrane protein YtjA (UPF0391 family)
MGPVRAFYRLKSRRAPKPSILFPALAQIFAVFDPGTFVPSLDCPGCSQPGLSRQWRAGAAFELSLSLNQLRGCVMLGWVVTFLIIALIAGILGFGGVAGASIEIAKIIFFIAIVLFLVSAVVGLARGRTRV